MLEETGNEKYTAKKKTEQFFLFSGLDPHRFFWVISMYHIKYHVKYHNNTLLKRVAEKKFHLHSDYLFG